jgi:hypothetical protein
VDGIPAGAYLTLLALFAILIGPVNQFLLRKRRQQALIVLTTPIIAAVFIVLLGGYVALVEGFAIRGRVTSLTLLDQTAAEAVTRASVSVYASGRAPSGGLRFARDVAVFATPLDTVQPSPEALDLSETQQFTSGFVRARTPTNFETIVARTARERLTFRRDGSELRVSNGLGGTVTRLLVRHGDRTYQLSDALPEGASAPLHVSTAAPQTLRAGGDLVLARFDPMLANLPDGSYVAVLDRSPFWDGGTPDIEERNSFHLVRGRAGALP